MTLPDGMVSADEFVRTSLSCNENGCTSKRLCPDCEKDVLEFDARDSQWRKALDEARAAHAALVEDHARCVRALRICADDYAVMSCESSYEQPLEDIVTGECACWVCGGHRRIDAALSSPLAKEVQP